MPGHDPRSERGFEGGEARRPTVRDVARASGVSTSTAARALSGRGRVAAGTRSRVLDAAEALGYVPNAVARGLRARSTNLVGVLISDIANAFYAEVADGAEKVLRARGYQMLLADSDGGRSDVEASTIRTFQSMQVDGLIITSSVPPTGAPRRLLCNGAMVVEVDNATGVGDAVLVDNERGAYQATRHLIELGHRRIGLVVGQTAYTSGKGRLEGYREALREFGIELDESLVAHTSYHPADPSEAARALLRGHPEMTSVFATNGPLALGVLQVLREENLAVPHDISLVAFDDATWMEMATPGITTVAQPTREIGRVAATLLLDRLAGDLTGRPEVRRLPTRFVRRASTAAPRSAG